MQTKKSKKRMEKQMEFTKERLLQEEIKALELQIMYMLADLRVIGENVDVSSMKKIISKLTKEKSKYEGQLNNLRIKENIKYAVDNKKLSKALKGKTLEALNSELSHKYQFPVGCIIKKVNWVVSKNDELEHA
jgi:hypothetical protein